MNFKDLFVPHDSDKGVATTELPSDNTDPNDVRKVLEGLTGLYGEVSGVVNGFTKGEDESKQKLVSSAPTAGGGPNVWLWVGLAAVAALFFLRRK